MPEVRPDALSEARWLHRDDGLTVASEHANPGLAAALAEEAAPVCKTPHFSIFVRGEKPTVLHRLGPHQIDNDLAEFVAGEIVRPGRLSIPNAFERCFAGVVLSSAVQAGEAWRLFYRNTLARIEETDGEADGPGPIASFAGIYAHAASLLAGDSLLDVGTCFGFFPLLVKHHKPQLQVTALDLSARTLHLAGNFGSHEKSEPVEFIAGDACDLPFPDRSFDTVTALHLLEHLPDPFAGRAVSEACRVARRRVVVAVPMEKVADPAYGHVRTFDLESLPALVGRAGWRCESMVHLGGWVVLERVSSIDYNATSG